MSANSKIEWTDHTFNPWRGCTKVSPGCAHCYAETLSKRNPALLGTWGAGQPRVLASEKMWGEPVKWNAAAAAVQRDLDERRQISDRDGDPKIWQARRPRVFTASLADWLDDEVPIEWLARLLQLIHDTPNLDWLLLTKRPQNWDARLSAVWEQCPGFEMQTELGDWLFEWLTQNSPPANVWIGVSVEDQVRADERIPLLLAIPAKVRFLSCEPLLGSVSLGLPGSTDIAYPDDFAEWTETRRVEWFKTTARAIKIARCSSGLNWVICGGESGPDARPMHPEWARGLRDQCEAAGVPFFFKQWGEWAQLGAVRDDGSPFNAAFLNNAEKHVCQRGEALYRVGKTRAMRLLDGREHSAFPHA